MKILPVLPLLAVVMTAGCVSQGLDINAAAKAIPQVQSFLDENPNADIRAILYEEDQIEGIIDEIRGDCGNQFKVGEYYKVEITDGDNEILVWYSVNSQKAICILREGERIDNTEEETPSGEANVEGDISVSKDDDPMLGNEDAPITIIKFGEFEDPFGARFWRETLPSIEKNYIENGYVNFVFRDVPFIHSNAEKAAIASECADEQGRYWEYYNYLYANYDKLSNSAFVKIAQELNLDIDEFESCMSDESIKNEVQMDGEDWKDLAGGGVPVFFIGNGEDGYIKVSGAQLYTFFRDILNEMLGVSNYGSIEAEQNNPDEYDIGLKKSDEEESSDELKSDGVCSKEYTCLAGSVEETERSRSCPAADDPDCPSTCSDGDDSTVDYYDFEEQECKHFSEEEELSFEVSSIEVNIETGLLRIVLDYSNSYELRSILHLDTRPNKNTDPPYEYDKNSGVTVIASHVGNKTFESNISKNIETYDSLLVYQVRIDVCDEEKDVCGWAYEDHEHVLYALD